MSDDEKDIAHAIVPLSSDPKKQGAIRSWWKQEHRLPAMEADDGGETTAGARQAPRVDGRPDATTQAATGCGMSDVTVVHLVRKANGPEALRAFAKAYTDTTRGDEADVVYACKGFSGDVENLWLRMEPGASELHLPDTGYDLGTYRRAAELVSTEFVCFLNSFSRPLVKGWLDIMLRAAREPLVGIVGCTGSWEGIPGAPFPNPHIRTNAFLMRRELFLSLDMPEPQTKADASQLEAGPNGITRQIERRGLAAFVVNTIQDHYPPRAWRHSNTFRLGNQCRLLVADNRTDHYANASPEEQVYLRKLAWGKS